MEQMRTILEFCNIQKSFAGTSVLKDINISIFEGEVIALIGENGAGKSTLMKILAGAYSKDDGKVLLEGKEVEFKNPIEARNEGISIIYQELSLVPTISIAENIFLGRLPTKKSKVVDWRRIFREAEDYLKQTNLAIDPRVLIKDLSIAQCQMVEISRALSLNSKIVIMDEPTSSLTDIEVSKLFEIIKKLKSQGVTVIYISHKLEEIMSICDRVVVLKDGVLTGVRKVIDTNKDELITLMVGRDLDGFYSKREGEPSKDIVLEVQNLTVDKRVKDVSFKLYKGEILGFSGLVGAGRTETMRAIFGADKKDNGKIYINEKEIIIKNPKQAIKSRIAFVTEDRRSEGLVMKMSIRENTTLSNYSSFSNSMGHINKNKEVKIAKLYVEKMKTKTDSIEKRVIYLSGGNQQKVVISKWLNTDADIFIFDEPTRGIDVGAKADIYQLIYKLAYEGKSIIMVSSELPELISVCDRIIVMNEGRITGEVMREEATEEKIMSYAVGGI